MDWMGAGLPYEGTAAERPTLHRLIDVDVPVFRLDASTDDVQPRLADGAAPFAVVVNDQQVVLGTVKPEAVTEAGRRVRDVMTEGPSTYRPHVSADELAPKLGKAKTVLVTTSSGRYLGVVAAETVRAAAGDDGGSGD